MRNFYLDPAACTALASAYALLFGLAGAHKLRHNLDFHGTLAAYDLLPEAAVGLIARALPVLELMVAGVLLRPQSRRAGCLMAAALLLMYAAAMSVNLWRGRRELDCGCLGFGRGQQISYWLVTRNLALVGLALLLALVPWSERSLLWVDVLTVLGGIVLAAVLYAAADGLIESARHLPRRATGSRT